MQIYAMWLPHRKMSRVQHFVRSIIAHSNILQCTTLLWLFDEVYNVYFLRNNSEKNKDGNSHLKATVDVRRIRRHRCQAVDGCSCRHGNSSRCSAAEISDVQRRCLCLSDCGHFSTQIVLVQKDTNKGIGNVLDAATALVNFSDLASMYSYPL